MATRRELLQTLAQDEGFDDIYALLGHASVDSVVPAICTACQATGQMEPDGVGYCDECGHSKMTSCLVLAGVI